MRTPIEIALAVLVLGCGTSSNEADAGDAGSDVASDVTVADAAPEAESLTAWSTPITLSDPPNQGFAPSVAARDGEALVAWHEFVGDAGARIRYAHVAQGVPDATQTLADPFAPAIRASVATTTNGYVLAYQANDGTRDVVRAVELDATGNVTSGPDTISSPNQTGSMQRVASNGGEEVFAWTDGTAHWFAMRGAGETVPASLVGSTLLSQGLLNFPRVAIDAAGNVFIAYRDGGTNTSDWDVLLVTRAPGAAFGAPVDVSNSSGLLSDDISLALEDDGTLDFRVGRSELARHLRVRSAPRDALAARLDLATHALRQTRHEHVDAMRRARNGRRVERRRGGNGLVLRGVGDAARRHDPRARTRRGAVARARNEGLARSRVGRQSNAKTDSLRAATLKA